MYQIVLEARARSQFRKLDKSIAQRILEKLNWLAENADSLELQALAGPWAETFKLRIGSYRVIYILDRPKQTIVVVHVAHRSEVYKHSAG
ncbi:MAG: type II toxin-antitoxin system RelE/ParE family toxin [Anaerolineales bacterium]